MTSVNKSIRKTVLGRIQERISRQGQKYFDGYLDIEGKKIEVVVFKNSSMFREGLYTEWKIIKKKKEYKEKKKKKSANDILKEIGNNFLSYSKKEDKFPDYPPF